MILLKYTNRAVVFINIWFCIVLGYIVTNREIFQGISDDIFPDANKLMDSYFADTVVRTEFVLIYFAIVIFILVKERRFKDRYVTRLWSNTLIGLFLLVSSGYLLSCLYPI